MDQDFKEIVLFEIRENRKEIQSLKEHVFSNKMRLTVFMAGMTLLFNLVFVVITEKIKQLL